jgi:transcription initiation factor TFIIIB Brf1 subunit/transcription initiation factor TFIIB
VSVASRHGGYVSSYWYPSSTTCSACGAVKATLRLAERTYHCEQCGLVLDRDLRRRPQPRPTRGRGQRAARPPRGGVGDAKRARWKPTQDPHLAGSGYRHGTTHTTRCRSTPAQQRADSGHVFTHFLNGKPDLVETPAAGGKETEGAAVVPHCAHPGGVSMSSRPRHGRRQGWQGEHRRHVLHG